MKNYRRNITTFFMGVWGFVKEKLGSLFAEMKQRGESRRQERGHEQQESFFARAKTSIAKAIKKMRLARAVDLEALGARVAANEQKYGEAQLGPKSGE